MIDDAVRSYLEEKRFGVLATLNRDGSPQQTVMWYELIGDCIMMNTAIGRTKNLNVLRDDRISVCVEDDYRYVTLAGRAEFDDDPERSQADIARLARRYHPPEKAEQMIKNFQTQERITIWLHVERVMTKDI